MNFSMFSSTLWRSLGKQNIANYYKQKNLYKKISLRFRPWNNGSIVLNNRKIRNISALAKISKFRCSYKHRNFPTCVTPSILVVNTEIFTNQKISFEIRARVYILLLVKMGFNLYKTRFTRPTQHETPNKMDGEVVITGTKQESSTNTSKPINIDLSQSKINEILDHKTLEVK